MVKTVIKSMILAVSTLIFAACGGSGSTSSGLSQDLKDAITYMYNEESLAYDVYMAIYKKQTVEQLKNIAENSETKHIEAVNQLAIKYDLNMTTYDPTLEPYSIDGISNGVYPGVDHIQFLYDTLYAKGIQSKKDALEVGCMVEVVDVIDLQEYIKLAEESNALDVLDEFNVLLAGSYNHYWAFDSALMNLKGSTDPFDGCCSVVDALGYSFCHSEYPKN